MDNLWSEWTAGGEFAVEQAAAYADRYAGSAGGDGVRLRNETQAPPAQILLRVPPVAYNTVRVYYDGSWHDTQFGARTHLINVSVDRLGDVTAFTTPA